jgi:uncharacterized protein (DUF1330 family)
MNSATRLAMALAVGIATIGVAVQGIQAQAKPPVYVVNEVEVIDAAGMKAYADAQSVLIKKHGGRYIIQAGKILATLSGSAPAGRYTIYTFENADKMQAWRDDPGQKDVLAVRDKVAKFRSFVVEGLPQ